MMPRSLLFLGVLVLFVTALVALVVLNQLRTRRLAKQSWEELLGRLIITDPYKIKRVASSLLEAENSPCSQDSQDELDPEEIWDLLGGLEGLETLANNCSVLVELACYVQQTYPEALVVAEQLRLNAREVNWHVSRLLTSSRVETLHASFPHYAQRAAATYFQMTLTLLALSRASGFPGHADLQAAL